MGDVVKVDWGNTNLTKAAYEENGKYLGVSAAGCDGRMSNFEHDVGVSVLSAIGANCGKVFYPDEKFTAIKNTITFTPNRTVVVPKYLFFVMRNNQLPQRGGAQPFMAKADVESYIIPLPSIDDQRRIVAKLEAEQEIIDANKRLIDLMQDKINQVMNRIYKCDA